MDKVMDVDECRCGRPLVVNISKKDGTAGQAFEGCPDFSCKFRQLAFQWRPDLDPECVTNAKAQQPPPAPTKTEKPKGVKRSLLADMEPHDVKDRIVAHAVKSTNIQGRDNRKPAQDTTAMTKNRKTETMQKLQMDIKVMTIELTYLAQMASELNQEIEALDF